MRGEEIISPARRKNGCPGEHVLRYPSHYVHAHDLSGVGGDVGLVSLAMGRKDLLVIMADFSSMPKGEKALENFPDLKGRMKILKISRGKLNLRVIMSAEQALGSSVERALPAIREACEAGLC